MAWLGKLLRFPRSWGSKSRSEQGQIYLRELLRWAESPTSTLVILVCTGHESNLHSRILEAEALTDEGSQLPFDMTT